MQLIDLLGILLKLLTTNPNSPLTDIKSTLPEQIVTRALAVIGEHRVEVEDSGQPAVWYNSPSIATAFFDALGWAVKALSPSKPVSVWTAECFYDKFT